MSSNPTAVATFWDRVFTADGRVEVPKADDAVLCSALQHFGEVQDKLILDIGCGRGTTSLFFASHGAQVVSIDISEVAIRNLTDYCREQGITNIRPMQLRAQDIESIGKCDGVFGSMILHHIEPFAQFASTLRRTISPGGKGFFYENNSSSKLMIWFRKHIVGKLWIPKHGDSEEFPLEPAEVRQLQQHFQVEVEYPELLYFRMISAYLLRCRLMKPFEWLDRFFYRYPSFRRRSYRQYVKLS